MRTRTVHMYTDDANFASFLNGEKFGGVIKDFKMKDTIHYIEVDVDMISEYAAGYYKVRAIR